MSAEPNNLTKTLRLLHEAGFRDWLDRYGTGTDEWATADDDGHLWYPEVASVYPCGDGRPDSGVTVDLENRTSEACVHLRTHVSARQLVAVARVLEERHKSAKHKIGIDVIVTSRVAVEVCKALRKAGPEKRMSDLEDLGL